MRYFPALIIDAAGPFYVADLQMAADVLSPWAEGEQPTAPPPVRDPDTGLIVYALDDELMADVRFDLLGD